MTPTKEHMLDLVSRYLVVDGTETYSEIQEAYRNLRRYQIGRGLA